MRTIEIDELQEGMISNQTICDSRGIILIAKGVKLTSNNIRGLRKFHLEAIDIQEEAQLPEQFQGSQPAGERVNASLATLKETLAEQKTISVEKNYDKIKGVLETIVSRPDIQPFLGNQVQSEELLQHSIRTTILSVNMGLLKGYDGLNLEFLGLCTLLHDCGMDKEFDEKDTDHPYVGFAKLRDVLSLDMVIALVCLQHHEYYDGSGFPFGFNKTQITEFARMIAVVDHYDRLVMRKTKPRQALFKIIGGKGRQFDPQMIDLLGEVIDWSRIYV